MARSMPTTSTLLMSLMILFLNNLTSYSQVLDKDGHPLRPGVDYYILPSARATIGLSSPPNGTCPLDVVLQTDIHSNALPVRFYPAKKAGGVIKTDTDLNIEFSASTICVISTVWKIQGSSNDTSTRYFVTIGGVKGKPGKETISNWFNIRSDPSRGYVLNFCPSVCETCRPFCGNLGIILDNGRSRLGITSDDQALGVSFTKAS